MKVVNLINVGDNSNYLTLVDGLDLEKLKTRYNWLFNASINNAVVGEDNNGLVWYMGDWYCGEWKGGTWYSGTWYDGTWNGGKWYSYNLDRYELFNQKFSILDKNEVYSKFLNGTWVGGTWYDGTFGDSTIDITGYTHSQIEEGVGCAIWKGGDYYDGIFQNAIWCNGNFYNGEMKYTQWKTGNFFNGSFYIGSWWNGNFLGGDFMKGDWEYGYFTIKDSTVNSRFGYNFDPSSATTTRWYGGIFENGEFYSGYQTGSTPSRRVYQKIPINRIITSNQAHIELDNLMLSNNHNRTHWYEGTFKNGYWFGGTFNQGLWEHGVWYNGVFSGATLSASTWTDGYWYDGLWVYGTYKGGYWYGGMWLDGQFDGGSMLS